MCKIFNLLMVLALSLPMVAADHVMQATRHYDRPAVDSVLTLSLTEAQDYAVRSNRTLRNASLAVQEAYAQRWQTIASMLPQSDASWSYTNYCNYSAEMAIMGQTAKISMPNYSAFGVTSAVGFNAQGIIGAVMQTQAIAIKKIQYEQSELELSSNVWQSYASILALESITNLLDSSLTNLEKLEEISRESFRVGVAEQTTVDQVHVRVVNLRNNINAQRRAIDLARAGLKVLLDVPVETELVLSDNLNSLLGADRVLDLLSEHFNIENNHNYQLLQQQVKIAKLGVHSAAWAYGPTVSAAHVYNNQHYYDDGGMRMTPPNLVQLSVSMPLWSSGKRAASVVEKKIALEEAKNTMATTTDQLYVQNQQLRNTLTNYYETYLNERDNIEVSQRVFDSTSRKFYYGTASNADLVNASNDLIAAQSGYVTAILNLVGAQIDLVKFLNNK